jgi:hypothetical protein
MKVIWMMVEHKSPQLQWSPTWLRIITIVLLLCLFYSEYVCNKRNDVFEEQIKNILKILKSSHVMEVIRCDFGYEEDLYLVVLTKDPIEKYKDCVAIFQKTNSGYKLVFRYSDKYGYACYFLAGGSLFQIPGLVTMWCKFSDRALVIFGKRGDKIMPIFQKLGGVFIAEFGDVNNDGLTDILISELEWTIDKGRHVRKPKITKIYLRRVSESGDWFVFFEKSPLEVSLEGLQIKRRWDKIIIHYLDLSKQSYHNDQPNKREHSYKELLGR